MKRLIMFLSFVMLLTVAYPTFANGQGIQGNTQGNLANSGFITEDKNWYYYSDGSIYKIRKNGKDKTKIIDATKSNLVMPSELTIIGNCLYYTDFMGWEPNSNVGIYRLDLNSKKEQFVTGMHANNFKIVNNKIYFLAYNNMNWSEQSIYVSDMNGKNKRKLTGTVSSFTTDGSYLYYKTNSGFYRASLDNRSKVKLSTQSVNKPIIFDKSIYYINKSDKDKLYKMSIDGKNNIGLTKNSVGNFNIYNGKIIYSNKVSYPNSSSIFMMNTNGKNTLLLAPNTFDYINVLGDKVLYATRNKNLAGWADYRLSSMINGKLNKPDILFTVKYP